MHLYSVFVYLWLYFFPYLYSVFDFDCKMISILCGNLFVMLCSDYDGLRMNVYVLGIRFQLKFYTFLIPWHILLFWMVFYSDFNLDCEWMWSNSEFYFDPNFICFSYAFHLLWFHSKALLFYKSVECVIWNWFDEKQRMIILFHIYIYSNFDFDWVFECVSCESEFYLYSHFYCEYESYDCHMQML